jgi:RHS repeat-associated protein
MSHLLTTIRRPFSILSLLVLLSVCANAQTTTTSTTDRMTPSGLATGSPAGSYALSGFDIVNPFNGNMDVRLPLLAIAGRGAAAYQMTLAFNVKGWRVKHLHKVFPDGNELDTDTPTKTGWGSVPSNYAPGSIGPRQVGLMKSSNMSCTWYSKTLTRLNFSTPDGTEYELRDQLTGGQPLNSTCTQGASRGSIFVTADGSSATFTSDVAIYDSPSISGSGLTLSGYLMLRDGTRFRFDAGKLTWMRDANGNKLSFTYTATSMTVTDTLNRQVTVETNVADVAPYGVCDRITYSGFGGAQRVIRISSTTLSNVLRPGYSIQTIQQLFPELNGSSSTTTHNPTVVSAIWLPDGRRYQLFYNSYSELAKVILPTGGAIEYDMTPGSGVICAYGPCGSIADGGEIYRRVVERRLYPNGATLEGKSTFAISPGGYPSTQPWTSTVTVDQLTPAGSLLAREMHYYKGNAAGSLFQSYSFDVYSEWDEGFEYRTETLAADGTTVLRRVEKELRQRAPVSWWSAYASQYGLGATQEPANDPRVVETIKTLLDTNQISKQSALDPQTGAVGFDQYNNPTDVYEYHYGTGAVGALARRTHTEYANATNLINGLNYAANDIHLRGLPVKQQVFDADGVTERARTTYEYDNYASDTYHAALVDCPGVSGRDAAFTSLYTTRGNATRVSRWLLSSETPINSYVQYDIVGNSIKAIDGRGQISQVGYSSTYQYAYPTSTTSPIPDPVGTYGTNTPLTASTVYDFSTGLVTSSTDTNGKTTSLSYNDALDRLTTVTRPTGGGSINYFYNDTVGNLYVRTRTSLDNTRSIEAYQFYDNMGRPTRSFLNEGGSPVVYITSDTQYDSLGRVWKVSNPYRTDGSNDPVNPSGNWTTTTYDALSRVKTVTSPDGAQVVTTYSGNQVTIQDQMGKVRSSVTDALGRLKQVTEAPTSLAYQTDYSYDVLDNLHTVSQGSQLRYFMYDSLSRLIRVKNPEQSANAGLALADSISGNSQWSLAYTYDNNGNIVTKTDARGVTATYVYDNINRNTNVSYSDATPAITRYYDGAVNGKGRPWLSYAGSSHTANDNYDAMGRLLSLRQHFYINGVWSAPYITQRDYDLAGGVISQTYPSGRVVNYTYDIAGRTSSFTGNLGDGVVRTYADSISYDEWSGINRERYGTDTPLYHKEHRNVRGQLYDVRLSSVNDDLNWNRGAIVNYYSLANYGFGTSGWDNNGNLMIQQSWVPGDDAISTASFMQQNYDYDALNRLKWTGEYQNGASQTGGQEYLYDRYGNRTLNPASWGAGINNQPFTVDTSTNRLGVPSGMSGVMQYDAAGNLTNDTYSGAGSRTYDAENRMISATNYSNQQSVYTYDADGARVRRTSYGQETWQVYGMDGELLTEYAANAAASAPQKEYGYRSGQLLVITEGGANAVSDFSATQNNGIWKYGYKTLSGSTFNAFPSHANLFGGGLDSWSPGYCCPMITRNATGTTYTYPGAPSVVQPADVLNLHPGPSGEKSVVRWTAPAAGTYTISGRFQGIDTAGTTTDVTILHNTTAVFAGNINGYGNQVTFAVTRTVAAGDTIDFQVGYGSNNSYGSDSTGLSVTITPQSAANLQWLIADQLGTPRMIADTTGSLAGIRRHDYLPFGEELFAGTGNRTPQQGYVVDGVRQQFTQYERDTETNLDYAQARYYASVQGRFISTDPLLASGRPLNPKTWNRYAYALNNPLRFVDPDGLDPQETHADVMRRIRERQQNQPIEQTQTPIQTEIQLRPPIVRNATPAQQGLIASGYAEATNRLNSIQPCAAFFGGADNGVRALFNLDPYIDSSLASNIHPQGVLRTEGLAINPNSSGFLTPDGAIHTFFVFSDGALQEIALTGAQARAFGLLHESAHEHDPNPNRFGETDIDGVSDPKDMRSYFPNYINNTKIWKACFSEVKSRSPTSNPFPGLGSP